MAGDVIELSQGRGHVEYAELLELIILQANGLDPINPLIDLDLGQIDADELVAGNLIRHRDQVTARRAADFQYAAFARGGETKAQQMADDREPIRVGLGTRIGFVGDFFVSGLEGVMGNAIIKRTIPPLTVFVLFVVSFGSALSKKI